MEAKNIFPSGLVRSTPDSASADGSLLEAINSRYRDGARKVVGGKVAETNKLTNLPGNEKVYHHPSSGKYICIVQRSSTYYIEVWTPSTTGGVQNSFYPGAASPSAFTQITLGTSGATTVTYIGNFVYVSTSNDSFILFWDNIVSAYRYLLPIAPLRFAATTVDNTQKAVFVDNTGLTTDQQKYDAVLGQFAKTIAEYVSNGYFHGHLVLRYAFKLFDGSYVMHSDVFYARGGYLYDTSPTALAVDIDDTGFSTIKQNGNPVQFDKLKLFIDSTSVDSILQDYVDAKLIKSVCVFASQIIEGYRIPTDYTDLISYSGKLYFPTESILDITDQQSLFLIKEFTPTEFMGVATTWVSDDLKDIALGEAISSDNFTHHKLIPNCQFTLNNKIHLGNTKTILGATINSLFHNYFTSVYSSITLDSDIADIIMGGYTTHVDVPTDFDYFATIELLTDDGLKRKTIQFTEGFYENGSTNVALIMNPSFIYPDIRAKSVYFWVRWKADGSTKLINTFQFKESQYSNFAYTIESRHYPGPGEDQLLKCFYLSVPKNWVQFNVLDPWTDSTFSDTIHDYNRVQVSRLNNPFVFPAENSYRFGSSNNEVTGMITAQEPITETVFGQYPLNVFTFGGIYALEQGTGGVLYSNVVEVNKEILSNPDGLLGLSGAIVFVTKEGLKILQGRQVIDIGLQVRGSATNTFLSDFYLSESLNDEKVCQLSDKVSDSFLDYIQDSVLDYSNVFNEIVVSNPSEAYSFVYSLDTKSWHTISESWSQFPAYKSGRFYDLNTEGDSLNHYIQTRPFFLEDSGFKKINSIIVRSTQQIADSEFDVVVLWGSNDSVNWACIGKMFIANETTAPVLRNIPGHYRFFSLAILGKSQNKSITSIDVNFTSRYNNKIR